MSPPSNGIALLGKRKRACERCAQNNYQCDFEEDSSRQNCIAARTSMPANHVPTWHVFVLTVFIACNTTMSSGISQQILLPRPSPGSWDQHYLNESLDSTFHLFQADTPRSANLPSTSRGATGGSHSQWQASPTSHNAGRSSQQTSPGSGGPLGSLPFNPGGSDRGNGEASTISTIMSRLTNGGAETQSNQGVCPDDIPLSAAASFFRSYFTVIHPQYPFLDVKTCAEYYDEWKRSLANATLIGWPVFFVNMVIMSRTIIT